MSGAAPRCYASHPVPPRRHARRSALALAALAAVVAAGCGGRETPAPAGTRPGELQTVDVAPPPDARVDVSRDAKERRRAETFSGVLPGGFPRTLPLPPQASLVDQGRGGAGAWVDLLVPRSPAAVRGPYLQQLRAAGWEVTAAGADAWPGRRAGATVRLSLRAQGPSARLRLEY